jgi:hypothetical protein
MNKNCMNFMEDGNCCTTQTSARICRVKKMKKKRTGKILGVRRVKEIGKKSASEKNKKIGREKSLPNTV